MKIPSFRLATINVRGLADKHKRESSFSWIENNNIDVCCMQETFCTSKNVTYINEYCRGHVVH